ncbi:MAG: glycosyltransferase 87 family protein [Candidatus Omnitrophica bacterium]|nr:glycosyltransferase 87 family protein [Candidatus Omnitrophota bacterium]
MVGDICERQKDNLRNMVARFKKAGNFILSDKVFIPIIAILIIAAAIVTGVRGGKDLKVALYGVEKMMDRQSPYDNPTDANRPIFRYAPAMTILQAPFMLTSKPKGPFEFEHMLPSVLAWYLAVMFALIMSIFLLMRIMPSPSRATTVRNLKISILIAVPLIGYELVNSQNKLMALAFAIAAIYLFEKKKNFFSAVLLSLAMTVYIPTFFLAVYFIIRSRGMYIVHFILGVLTVFIVIPSLVWGVAYNNFVLKDWYLRCLKPFFMTTSYNTYMELRSSSQSLPSAIGRIFVCGRTTPYKYIIPPEAIHIIIRVISAGIFLTSAAAVWRRIKPRMLGISFSLFLLLPLLTPSYCLWYTWAWIFVPCLAVLNYLSYPDIDKSERLFLKIAFIVLVAVSYSAAIMFFNDISVMFWGTLFFWGVLAFTLIKDARRPA